MFVIVFLIAPLRLIKFWDVRTNIGSGADKMTIEAQHETHEGVNRGESRWLAADEDKEKQIHLDRGLLGKTC